MTVLSALPQGPRQTQMYLEKAGKFREICVMRRDQRNTSSERNSTPRAAAAEALQSSPTLYNPTDGSPPGSPVPGILQARTLDWVAISFSNA